MTNRTLDTLRTNAVRTTAVLATLGTLHAEVSADIVEARFTSVDDFAFIVQDMPDFDQIRADVLPNDGRCYCGPAAVVDLLGYVATHGSPDVDPGIPFISWYQQTEYDRVSTLMGDIGSNISVAPGGDFSTNCGTGLNQLHDVLVARIGDRFTVRNSVWDGDSGYAPSTAQVALRGWADQAVGILNYGRWAGEFMDGVWFSNQRRGGHFEVVNRAFGDANGLRLGLRNPWDTAAPEDVQSAFSTHFFDVQPRAVTLNGDPLIIEQLNSVYLSAFDHDDDPDTAGIPENRMRMFEAYLSIAPKCCYSWDEFNGSIVRLVPNATIWSRIGEERRVIPMPAAPSRVAFGPSDLAIASIIDGHLHRTTREPLAEEPHERISFRLPGWPGATDLAFDARRRLHLSGGDRVATIDWNSGELLGSTRLPGEGTSIAITDGIVHVLVPEMHLVAAINEGPNGPFVVELPLPADAVVKADSTIAMLPGGRLFLLTDGVLNPMQIAGQGFQRLWLPVPRDGEWNDMSVDDNDTICLVDAQGLVEAYQATDNGFQRMTNHAFDGVVAGRRITIARSTSNATPEDDDRNSTIDLDLDDREIEIDCAGDLNFDRRVDSADIGLMLGEWGSQRSIADLDRSGLVDSADLGLLLGGFGICP